MFKCSLEKLCVIIVPIASNIVMWYCVAGVERLSAECYSTVTNQHVPSSNCGHVKPSPTSRQCKRLNCRVALVTLFSTAVMSCCFKKLRRVTNVIFSLAQNMYVKMWRCPFIFSPLYTLKLNHSIADTSRQFYMRMIACGIRRHQNCRIGPDGKRTVRALNHKERKLLRFERYL